MSYSLPSLTQLRERALHASFASKQTPFLSVLGLALSVRFRSGVTREAFWAKSAFEPLVREQRRGSRVLFLMHVHTPTATCSVVV